VILPVVNHNHRRWITVTPTDIVYERRLAAVTYAIEIKNIKRAAGVFGVSRKTLSGWVGDFRTYGPGALRPKEKRPPQMPNATPDHVISELVRLAVTHPEKGARWYATELSDTNYQLSKSCVQKHLNRLELGHRAQRLAAAGRLALFTDGLLTETVLDDLRGREGPFGFCHWAPLPGVWVQLDCFYIGRLKGVGEVWQLTATDVRTRTSDVLIIEGRPNSKETSRFLNLVVRRWAKRGFPLTGVVSDNGGEFKGDFATRVAALGIEHVRIPPRSPNHNAVVERFHQTMLEDCWRPAFHKRFFTSVHQLQIQANSWLVGYHNSPNHGDWMNSRTPNHILESDRPE
jgi:transposase InsO family protein